MGAKSLADKLIPPTKILDIVVKDIITNESAIFPDLSSLIVLVPNSYACDSFNKLLATKTRGSILMPKVTTLELWASNCAIKATEKPDMFFVAELYCFLKRNEFKATQNLWVLATEIFILFKEITLHSTKIPETEADFKKCFEEAYDYVNLLPLEFEANFISKMWQAFWTTNLNAPDGLVDSSGAYALRLRELVDSSSGPLYVIALGHRSKVEDEFLVEYANSSPVYKYEYGGSMLGAKPREQICHFSFLSSFGSERSEVKGPPFKQKNWKKTFDQKSSLLNILGTMNLESEAIAVRDKIQGWLASGISNIAVVGIDNLTARRVRALLERQNILLKDELGWLLSTTAASTVILRWVDTCLTNFNYKPLMDLVKSPFVQFDDVSKDEVICQLSYLLRKEGVPASSEEYVRLAYGLEKGDAVISLLTKLTDLAQFFLKEKHATLSDWLDRLNFCLNALGVSASFSKDQAGSQILALLSKHQVGLAESDEKFTVYEWIQWLKHQFETNEFYESDVASPIVLTKLENIRLRRFDAVILVGCDSRHLPGKYDSFSILGNSVRKELGLPGDKDKLRRVGENLLWLFSLEAPIFCTWQKELDGAPNLLSPMLQMLDLAVIENGELGVVSKTSFLHSDRLGTAQNWQKINIQYPQENSSAVGSVSLNPDVVPTDLSATGYSSLLNCPFQYFARYVLGLRALEDIESDITKTDFGIMLHEVLSNFHAKHPVLSELPPDEAKDYFAILVKDYLKNRNIAYITRLSWISNMEAIVEQYIDWQLEREERGWFYFTGEDIKTREITYGGKSGLLLRGKIDRVDTNSKGQFSLIDYKTTSSVNLKQYVDVPEENIQLIFYSSLFSERMSMISYLGLEKKGVKSFSMSDGIEDLEKKNEERLKAIFKDMSDGVPLPANGVEPVCGYCEMRGVCRKDFLK